MKKEGKKKLLERQQSLLFKRAKKIQLCHPLYHRYNKIFLTISKMSEIKSRFSARRKKIMSGVIKKKKANGHQHYTLYVMISLVLF